MKERIYTIPVNEAFDENDGCPFCTLFHKLEADELTIILGAAMMDPSIRVETNEKGFCDRHYAMMFGMKNRLGLALMLESHLDSLKKELRPGTVFSRDAAGKSVESVGRLNESCYVCSHIDDKISKMFVTAAYLYDEESEFRRKFDASPYICLPHYRSLLLAAKSVLGKEGYSALAKASNEKLNSTLSKLKDDISWFAKKFDYRYDAEPWGDSKDSVERAIRFLNGDDVLPH